MARTPKVKGPEAVGFKEIFGSTALSTNNGLAAVFMFTTCLTLWHGPMVAGESIALPTGNGGATR